VTYFASVPQAVSPVVTYPVAPTQVHDIDIILPANMPPSAAQMFADLFQAANDLIHTMPYRITVQNLAARASEDPRYWTRRSVIFLGDIHSRWGLTSVEQKRVHQILRLATRSVLIGGAIFLLREIGVQDHHSVAIHPNFYAAALEENLNDAGRGKHHAISKQVHSAISGFAALPLLIEMIGNDHGQFIANSLGDYVGLSSGNTRNQSKVVLDLRHRARGDKLIDNTLALMQEHIEEPLMICDLAQAQGVSTRKLQRRFLEKTGTGPLVAYRALRIERAHQLLVHTSLNLSEIIVATGFGTHSNLARWIRTEYGMSPQAVRRHAFDGVMS